jgi:hypothetical protein
MKPFRIVISPLLSVGLVSLLISCGGGGEPIGPGGVHVATSIAAASSIVLPALPGTDVTQHPSVLVRDETGAPLVGAPVTFTVTSGAGTITGGNATTDASGIATVGSWAIGSASVVNTLSVTSGTLTPVVFTSCAAVTHALESSSSGDLANIDCPLPDGTFIDFYAVTIPTGGTYVFDQSSTSFDTFLYLLGFSGTVIGVNDDLSTTVSNSRVTAIVPAGTYVLAANSFDQNEFGAYSLASATSTTPVTNCDDVFVLPGIVTPQRLELTDCSTNAGSPSTGFPFDQYAIFLNPGQTITVTMTSTPVDTYLEMRFASTGALVVSNDDIDGTTKNSRITYKVPVLSVSTAGFYIITAASRVAGVFGDYTLTIE